MPESLFECTSFKLGCNAKYEKKLSLKLFQMLTYASSFNKVWEEDFLTLLGDIIKPTSTI